MRENKLRAYAKDAEVMVYQKDFNKWIDGEMMMVEFISQDDEGNLFEETDFVTQLIWQENEGEEISIDNPPLYSADTNIDLMQYTGLKDKKGVEIYEGDVLRGNYMAYTTFDAVVKFGEYDQDGSGAEYRPSKCIGFYAEAILIDKEDDWGIRIVPDYMTTASLLDFEGIEVIGNIYEDPDLLEESP